VVPIAHANDGGGSTRIPAACCGLVGLKPSRGRLPNAAETDQLPIRIVSQGVLTRSVRDTAFLLAEAERRHRPTGGLTPIGHVTLPSARRLRIRVVTEGLTGPVAPEVANVVRGAAALCADLGHDVVESDMGVYASFGQDFLRYWAGLAFALRLGGQRIYGPGFDRSALEPFTIGLADFFGTVSLGIPAALARLRRLPARHAEMFESCDVLLSPTTGYPPPPLGYLSPDQEFRTHASRLLPFAGFTAVQNVAGTPAISLPLGVDATGRPIGVQFAAAFNDERTLLELAYELESAAPWPHTPDVGGDYSGVGSAD
jgi:amidase